MGQFFPVHFLEVLDSAIRTAANFYFVTKKKLDQQIWKFEKLEMICEKFSDFFLKIKICRKFWNISKIYYGKSYSKIIKKSKFSKNRDFQKKAENLFRKPSLTFRIFKNCGRDFFWYEVKICCGSNGTI